MTGLDTTFIIQAENIESPLHFKALKLLQKFQKKKEILCLSQQVLTEFIHIVTDNKRFEKPLSMTEAIRRAEFWIKAKEIKLVSQNNNTAVLFTGWLKQYQLGRKRILDTMLAATYFSNGISRIITSNERDFEIFNCFEIIKP